MMTDRLHILVGAHDGKWVWLRTNSTLVNDIASSDAYTGRLVVRESSALPSYSLHAGWRYGFTDSFSLDVDGVAFTPVASDYDLGEWLPWLSIVGTWQYGRVLAFTDSDNMTRVLSSTLASDSYCYGLDDTQQVALIKFGLDVDENRDWLSCEPANIYSGAGAVLLCRSIIIDYFVYPASYFNVL